MNIFKNALVIWAAAAMLVGCTYQYKPQEGVSPAVIVTKGTLTGKIVYAESGYSVEATGINGATFSMIPSQINSDYPREMPFKPGPTKMRIYITWPNGTVGKHLDMPFVAKPGERYRLVMGNDGSAKHFVSLLDSHDNMVQGVDFTLKMVTRYY